ncbi:MAG TPA: DNA-binding response regulator [Lachnospiraceae bacterium]|nr:DNA-binding response regulator [Lachnospiraceae bacterium]
MDTKTIAIIDDDVSIGDMLEETLHKEGYRTLRAWSGTEALYLLSQNHPDLVLLDLMLPGLDGEEVLPHIQGTPVIVLSAKGDIKDKVSLLRGGAADYMTKPFDIRELLARIAVQLRNTASPLAPVHRAGDLTVDTASHQVFVHGAEVRLTRTEYAILKLLIQNPGQAIAKGVILDRISEDTPDCTDSSLKQHISNLRRKLKETGNHDYIESVWGIGFRLSSK